MLGRMKLALYYDVEITDEAALIEAAHAATGRSWPDDVDALSALLPFLLREGPGVRFTLERSERGG